MSSTDMPVDEVMESLTGFDEIAVEKHLGLDIYTDAERKPILLMRALVFVLLRRGGATDVEARKTVMEMPLKAVEDYFPDEDPEPVPDDPASESGKDD